MGGGEIDDPDVDMSEKPQEMNTDKEDDVMLDFEDPVVDDNYDFLVGDYPLRYVGDDFKGSHQSKIYQTPNGKRYWCPEVDQNFKPVVGKVYGSYEEIRRLYENYGDKVGFGIRSAAYKKVNGVITHRLLTCNRAGTPRCKRVDTVNPLFYGRIRASHFRVTNCKACIRFSLVKGTNNYLIYQFVENHNHDFVSSDNMDLTRKSRHLNFDDIQFVQRMGVQKIGPVVAHRLQTALRGGHHNMNGTRNSFKNVSREIKMYIGERDIKLFLTRMKERAASLPNFAYEILHDGRELNGIFWADEVSRVSYESFGDVIAFDATYSTNKYNMIFVPFTGVDHHRKCVLFGAGLIRNETIESYVWLLQAFLSVHCKEPRLVLSDQDPAMRVAVPTVFKQSAHRLCMWHIMKKLPSKISGDLLQNTDLRRSIHKLVWNVYISVSAFEEQWENLIQEYNLEHHVWLSDMYGIRSLWVPAYFREIPMSCLMKTTSRCESSNALSKVNSSFSNTLSQFLMSFDTAVDHQRYGQRMHEFDTNITLQELASDLPLEQHVASIYTRVVFKDVQKEIVRSMLTCFITNVDSEEQHTFYTISHFNQYSDFVNQFKVSEHKFDKSFECSCNSFTRIGLLCRHIFLVFRFKKIEVIPDRYVLKRWCKEVLPSLAYSVSNRLSADTSHFSTVRNEVLDCVNVCVEHLSGRFEALNCFAEKIKEIKQAVLADAVVTSPAEKRAELIKKVVGEVPEDSDIDLTAPQGIRTKGCGTGRILVGPGEKAVEASKKTARLCRSCNRFGFHDSRNCKVKAKGGPSTQ